MSDIIIKTEHLTKDYGNGHGIFDISLEVKKGEVFGFIGTNGSGKTTTIRNMMGFIRPDGGNVSVLGMDSWEHSIDIKPYVSYVPGEIAFPKLASGTEFLKLQAEYLGVTDFDYMNKLIKMFQLDTTANLKRMSKGMKQKTAIVAALMGDRDILVLDEPTAGLDVEARNEILDILRQYMAEDENRSILISSHISSDLEGLCDDIYLIHDGKLLLHEEIDNIMSNYALVKVEERDYEAMDKTYFLAHKKERFGYVCLTNQKQYYIENYPKAVVENGNIDELILLMTGGK